MKNEGPTQHPLTFQHPALLALPKKERRRLMKRCWKDVMRQMGFWRWATIFAVVCIAMQLFVRSLIAPLKLHPHVTNFIVGGTAGGVGAILLTRMTRTRLVRRALEELGGHCLQCGYDIRATPDTCPECGAPIPSSV